MEGVLALNRVGKIEKTVIYLYLFLLPYGCEWMTDSLHSMSGSVSFFLHIPGLVLMFFLLAAKKRGYRVSPVARKLAAIILLLNLMSLVMALVQYRELGTLLGRNTITAATPHLLYYFQLILMILYNDYILSQIEFKKIIRVVVASFASIILIGYLQVFYLATKSGAALAIEKAIVQLFAFKEVYVERAQKLNLVTMEASFAGAQLSIFLLPLLLLLTIHNKINRKLGIVLILSLLPILAFNNSSSGYIGIAGCALCFLFLLKYKKPRIVMHIRVYVVLSVILGALLFWPQFQKSELFENTVLKVASIDNSLSTLHRTTSIYTNMRALVDYPILGVGNGIQGFYYMKYFPDWGFRSYESIALYYGESGWPGSGAFLPTYISSFGLVGLLLLGYAILSIRKNIRSLRGTDYGFLYPFFIVSFAVMMLQSYTTVNIIGNYYIVFILSLSAYRYAVSDPVIERLPAARPALHLG